ncbi:MAG: arginine--tRNA ligase [Gemmatimonadetes bacterium]|nr:arginine--tRNA ligase [Gemmatimonadota bacterium]
MIADPALTAELGRVLGELGVDIEKVHLERPRDLSLGDASSNLALTLARRLRRPPREIAEEIRARLDMRAAGLDSVEVAGPGFLNFRRSAEARGALLSEIIAEGRDYGSSDEGGGRLVMVEFVSANPTGPLHLGHARQAALGDATASILEFRGWKVHREYYYNDAGLQIERLAKSVHARYLQKLGVDGPDAEVPEEGYHGAYVAEIASALVESEGRALAESVPENLDRARNFAVAAIRSEQDRDLARFGVRFDEYYLESSLYDEGMVDRAVADIDAEGHAFGLDGAVWLRATDFGDTKDRVMVRSDGRPTYFAADVAYHRHKWNRGFKRVVNVQGADHHGTVARVRAGLQALGIPEGYPEYVLHSMVRVERGGEEVKASKRSGTGYTMRELVDEVGADVARYFFLMSRSEAQMVFDIDRALDRSDKNPVYKVQYAHARLCALFVKGGVNRSSVPSTGFDAGLLALPEERTLLLALENFPVALERAARLRAPHLICSSLSEIAGAVNSWYHSGHPARSPEKAALVDDPGLRAARLALARASQTVIGNGLRILGVQAPERM